MKVKVNVPEVVEMFNEIQTEPEKLFEMIRDDIREKVCSYLFDLKGVELTHFLGRKPYERSDGKLNYRNGSHARSFTVKGIGEVQTRMQGPEVAVSHRDQYLEPVDGLRAAYRLRISFTDFPTVDT
jgi:hypothetical protein